MPGPVKLYGVVQSFDLDPFPRTKAWLDRCLTRPRTLRARTMREAA
jgi:glutathione S-transferase